MLTEKILTLSDKQFHAKNIKILEDVLINNNYPIKIIKKEIKNTTYKHKNNNISSRNNNIASKERIQFVSIPYVKGLYENVENCPKNLILKQLVEPINTQKI